MEMWQTQESPKRHQGPGYAIISKSELRNGKCLKDETEINKNTHTPPQKLFNTPPNVFRIFSQLPTLQMRGK